VSKGTRPIESRDIPARQAELGFLGPPYSAPSHSLYQLANSFVTAFDHRPATCRD
jgi:hypothetical protein